MDELIDTLIMLFGGLLILFVSIVLFYIIYRMVIKEIKMAVRKKNHRIIRKNRIKQKLENREYLE
jgi:Na+/H+ antiporter NhaD/arsenite permease-like protein